MRPGRDLPAHHFPLVLFVLVGLAGCHDTASQKVQPTDNSTQGVAAATAKPATPPAPGPLMSLDDKKKLAAKLPTGDWTQPRWGFDVDGSRLRFLQLAQGGDADVLRADGDDRHCPELEPVKRMPDKNEFDRNDRKKAEQAAWAACLERLKKQPNPELEVLEESIARRDDYDFKSERFVLWLEYEDVEALDSWLWGYVYAGGLFKKTLFLNAPGGDFKKRNSEKAGGDVVAAVSLPVKPDAARQLATSLDKDLKDNSVKLQIAFVPNPYGPVSWSGGNTAKGPRGIAVAYRVVGRNPYPGVTWTVFDESR